MVKLKDLLKESSPGYENRQFGDPLPKLEDITKKYQEANGIKKAVKNEDVDSQLASLIKQKSDASEKMRQVWSKETGGDHKKSDAMAKKVNAMAKKIKALVAKK